MLKVSFVFFVLLIIVSSSFANSSGPIRSPTSVQKACARRVVMYVIAVCGETCKNQNGLEALESAGCCNSFCPDDLYRLKCCPNNLE
ncbi:hypothetical protein GCK72_011247 [Caenorhabditis remanei]|uniref:Uncharacterized protein n=1 Tax=Caenorhabditis remanei TaxID=31234 RepID=A0A6A5H996_CAERE|nr:hypothetical protein GCK72_011247 [Caenorhabditis remanei]KAF1762982.1 hypothetical protein GCK72_011247 [Caenorhabditis remanei]